ncbi:MAG: anti-sigma factor antagonist, partial [Comamonadaceae bacterium]
MDLIDVDRSAAVPVVVPRVRRLDASVAPAFRQAVVQLVEGGDRRLVMDLGGVEFLDSSGLGALVSILKAMG